MANYAQENADEVIKTDLGSALGMLGFAAFISVVLSVLAFAPSYCSEGIEATDLRVAAAAGALVLFGIVSLASTFFAGKAGRSVLLVLSIVGALAMACDLFLRFLGAPFDYGMFALMGIGAASGSCMWFVYACSDARRTTITYTSVGFAGGCLLCLVLCFLPDIPAKVTMIALWVLCIVLLFMLTSANRIDGKGMAISKNETDKRSKVQKGSTVMLAVSYFQLGLTCSFACYVQSFVGAACCLGIGVVVFLVVLIDSLGKGYITERRIYPFATPVSVLVLAALCLFDLPVPIVLLCLFAILFGMYLMFGYAALTRHVRFSHLSPVRMVAKARVTDMLGLLLGVTAGGVLSYLMEAGYCNVAIRIGVILAVAYTLIASFCHKPRFPEASAGIEVKGSDASSAMAKGQWKKRCEVMAEKYHLSERQFEVLRLISQGRNAEYVSQSLTISINTVQTHIRNIYQKAGVHTRQELLDKIENTKLYDED